jgi:isoamylase
MITAGDELARTQRGNNNAYCQDNELSWIRWDEIDEHGQNLLRFTRELLALRDRHIGFRRSRFFHGAIIPGTDVRDVTWITPAGTPMTQADWNNPDTRTLGAMLNGQAGARFLTARGDPEPDDNFLILLNAGPRRVSWTLPESDQSSAWQVRISTTYPTGVPPARRTVNRRVVVGGRTAILLIQYRNKVTRRLHSTVQESP